MASDTSTDYQARETWLARAVEIFRPRFVEVGFPLPERLRISIGFAPQRESAKIAGVCITKEVVADGVTEIFVSPEDADTVYMLETVLHELIHATLDNAEERKGWNLHSGRFAEIATRLGFMGPMTATPASPELAAELILIAEELGTYPGAAITMKAPKGAELPVGPDGLVIPISSGAGGGKTQSTRMIKLQCPEDGYTVRTTRKWLDVGLPSCPCGTQLAEA